MASSDGPLGEGAQPGNQQQALDAQIGGPRPEYDQYEVNQAGNINRHAEMQPGYGNARDGDGQMEQDLATGKFGDQPLGQGVDFSDTRDGEISGSEQTRGIGERPLDED